MRIIAPEGAVSLKRMTGLGLTQADALTLGSLMRFGVWGSIPMAIQPGDVGIADYQALNAFANSRVTAPVENDRELIFDRDQASGVVHVATQCINNAAGVSEGIGLVAIFSYIQAPPNIRELADLSRLDQPRDRALHVLFCLNKELPL